MSQLFEELAIATLDRTRATFEQRGQEYSDTMRECEFLTMWATMEVVSTVDATEHDTFLAIFLAGMVDMKLERMRGGYREDNLIDLIAYAAALCELMRQLTEGDKHDRDNTARD